MMGNITEANPGTVKYYDPKSGQFLTANYWKESDGTINYKTLPYQGVSNKPIVGPRGLI